MGDTVVWISGASSGIGAAVAASVPYPDARVIGINRRRVEHGEHLRVDLSNPAAWPGEATTADLVDEAHRVLFEVGL